VRRSKRMRKSVCGFLIGLLMALMGCGGTITDKVCEEKMFVDTIEAQSVLSYDSWTDFKDEWGLPYADEEAFGVLKEAYANVDFFGEFKEGNESVCEEYKIEFSKMLQNEVPFLDKRTGEKICIKDYGRFENGYDVNEYTYYFFDVDEDENNTPELVVRNSAGEMDIFRYDATRGECVLWCDLENCWYSLLGSRKVMWSWDGKYLAFYEIDSEGGMESVTFGISNWYSEQQSLHMVVMPKLVEAENKELVTEKMKTQGVYERSCGRWYFRVTEEQYKELMEEYWQAYELAEEKIEGVTYTYEELFGENDSKDIIVGCEAEYGCEFEILDKETETDLQGIWQVKELVGWKTEMRYQWDGLCGDVFVFVDNAWVDSGTPWYEPIYLSYRASMEELAAEDLLKVTWMDERYEGQEAVLVVGVCTERNQKFGSAMDGQRLEFIVCGEKIIMGRNNSYFEMEKVGDVQMSKGL